MLYIEVEGYMPMKWHIGEPNPVKSVDLKLVKKVQSVQADGDELIHIFHNSENLPLPLYPRVVQWFGDHAKFIVANII